MTTDDKGRRVLFPFHLLAILDHQKAETLQPLPRKSFVEIVITQETVKIANDRKVIPDPIDDRKFQE